MSSPRALTSCNWPAASGTSWGATWSLVTNDILSVFQDLPSARGGGGEGAGAGGGKSSPTPGPDAHHHATGGIMAAMSSDLDGFTTKLNAILQADLTHAAAAAGPLEVSGRAQPCLWPCYSRAGWAGWVRIVRKAPPVPNPYHTHAPATVPQFAGVQPRCCTRV